jgi:threonylcarbamoyladenosine tRNA methylthiotransferase MtaB
VASFYIENFGCRATQADGAALESQFLERGLERAGAARDAGIVVLNTCTVTESADKDARASIRRLQRENPGCRILVTGCYAQRAPAELAALPGVTWVVGNSHKHLAAEIATQDSAPEEAVDFESGAVSQKRSPDARLDSPAGSRAGAEGGAGFVPLVQLSSRPDTQVVVGDIFAHTQLLAAPVFESANERTRPNLKVQDGCDNRCSFCVIPYVRGQSRSLPQERVLAEVRSLVRAGYREVVISGINLGRWGRDLGGSSQFSALSSQAGLCRFEHLVRAIMEETSLEKLRISSVEPMDWSDELIAMMATSSRIAKHAHVPLQSASDAVLRRMHRKYRPWHYREKIRKIREVMPNAAIGADVMVGFPGETEAEFAETRRMVEELPFTYLHVFTYSARPGTPAAEHVNQVPVALARARNQELRELAAVKKAAFMRVQVGTVVPAITLRRGDGECMEALTDNYLKMKIPGNLEGNRWIEVAVDEVQGEMLVGQACLTRPSRQHGQTEVMVKNTQKSNKIIDLQPIEG